MLGLIHKNFATLAMLAGMLILALAAVLLILCGKLQCSDPVIVQFASGAAGLGTAIAGYSSHRANGNEEPK